MRNTYAARDVHQVMTSDSATTNYSLLLSHPSLSPPKPLFYSLLCTHLGRLPVSTSSVCLVIIIQVSSRILHESSVTVIITVSFFYQFVWLSSIWSSGNVIIYSDHITGYNSHPISVWCAAASQLLHTIQEWVICNTESVILYGGHSLRNTNFVMPKEM